MPKGPVIECAQCGGAIVAPKWSEYRSERCVRNVWSCEACGYRFEHSVYFSAPKIQPDLRVEENERSARTIPYRVDRALAAEIDLASAIASSGPNASPKAKENRRPDHERDHNCVP